MSLIILKGIDIDWEYPKGKHLSRIHRLLRIEPDGLL
jgi:GH18 family chitinase